MPSETNSNKIDDKSYNLDKTDDRLNQDPVMNFKDDNHISTRIRANPKSSKQEPNALSFRGAPPMKLKHVLTDREEKQPQTFEEDSDY